LFEDLLESLSDSMPHLLNLRNGIIAAVAMAGSVASVFPEGMLSSTGMEYRVLPSITGDQALPSLSLGAAGGYLVAQDNSVDGSGLGIRARRFFGDLSGARETFQVNAQHLGDQQNAKVALLKGGGAVFAWQGSTAGGHRIFARFLGANDTFLGGDIAVSPEGAGHQKDAAVAVLENGAAAIVWVEWGRDGSMEGIFAQLFSAAGAKIGGAFQVNQVGTLSQRSPAVAALENGGFAVAWVADEHRHANSIDIYARVFDGQGEPAGSELRLNTGEKICANPALAAVAGGFRAAWSALAVGASARVESTPQGWRDEATKQSAAGWDVETRGFDLQGQGSATETVVNGETRGDQFSPRLANVGGHLLVAWTSYGQDGADEGIYGRLLMANGKFDGGEFLVNTRTRGAQIYPAVSAAGTERAVVAWTSYAGGTASYDLFAQNYALAGAPALEAPPAPFVSSLSDKSICAAWSEIAAQEVVAYLVYVDDAASAIEAADGMITIERAAWAPGSTHTVRLAYRLADGRISPKSEAASAKTWGADANGDQLPDDWQTLNWGKRWPAADADSDLDGASNAAEFLAGTDPTDPHSVLRVEISARAQGLYLEWRTEPGNYYQLQVTGDFKVWRNAGGPRFAAATSDSVPVSNAGQTDYYRVIRMR